jgi:DNA polymerase-1
MNPMGTPHSRASHYGPNLAQVPKVQKLYGKECRGLFGAGHHKSGRFVQVGADMSGLQQRALGHYLAPIDGGAYGEMVVSQDIHWVYAQAATLVPEGSSRQEGPAARHHPRHRLEAIRLRVPVRVLSQEVGSGGAQVRHHGTAEGLPELYERFFGNGEGDAKVGERVRKEFDERLKLGELQTKLLQTTASLESGRSTYPA